VCHEVYYKEVVHGIMEAEKFQDLQGESGGDPEGLMVQFQSQGQQSGDPGRAGFQFRSEGRKKANVSVGRYQTGEVCPNPRIVSILFHLGPLLIGQGPPTWWGSLLYPAC
jgi:hypothetical protein